MTDGTGFDFRQRKEIIFISQEFQPTSTNPSGFVSSYCQKFSSPGGKVAVA
jgi:hypothetical protein